ncbi:MAG: hypothetical protein KY396_06435 [Actinobacteria bacterium]|nr:hypothetical protein [Actinomycetota bacterium]
MRARLALLVGLVVGAMISGATVVVAADGPSPQRGTADDRSPATNAKPTGSKNSICLLAFDTRTEYLDLPGAVTTVAAVKARKPCPGAAIGSFTAGTYVGAGGAISVHSMKATCVATGRFSNPCTVGESVNAILGGNTLRWDPGDWETHNLQLVWPHLKRGVWRFEVLLFGREAATDSVTTRTFTVTG